MTLAKGKNVSLCITHCRIAVVKQPSMCLFVLKLSWRHLKMQADLPNCDIFWCFMWFSGLSFQSVYLHKKVRNGTCASQLFKATGSQWSTFRQTWIKSPCLITSQPLNKKPLWGTKILPKIVAMKIAHGHGLSILLLVARCHLVTWRHLTHSSHPIRATMAATGACQFTDLCTQITCSQVMNHHLRLQNLKKLDWDRNNAAFWIDAAYHSDNMDTLRIAMVFYSHGPRLQTLKSQRHSIPKCRVACLKEFIGMKFRPEISSKIHTSSSNQLHVMGLPTP